MKAPNDEARRQPGFETNTQHDTAIIGHDDAERKRLERLRSIAALNGTAVYDLADGSYLLCRWGSRAVPSVGALSQLFAQLGMSA